MDFEFSQEQLDCEKEVEAFLDEHDDPEVFDVTRENMAQIVDTPKRREFMAGLGAKGWLGLTWPAELGGSEGEGVYEYLLNERLARRGVPETLYTDRGKIFTSQHLRIVCANLNVRLLHAKPFAAWSKGKVSYCA